MAGARRKWLTVVIEYTLAGVLSSIAVGFTLGQFGTWVLPEAATTLGLLAVLAVALLAVAREVNLVRFRLPQPLRQTSDRWGKRFGEHTTVILWGLDLGSTISTRYTFAGTWVLIVLALLAHDPSVGATAFLACWTGRAGAVWLAPLYLADARSGADVMDMVAARHRLLRYSHVLGVALLIGFVALIAR